MTDINYIYETIGKSDITLIGYTFKVERIKDEFISKLPCVKLGEIDSSFSIKSYLRDIKLNQILDEGEYFKWLVLDISDIIIDSNDISLDRVKVIKRIVEQIRENMYKSYPVSDMGSDFDDPESHQEIKFETPYKLIITSPLYKSPSSINPSDLVNNFKGGTNTMYMADFAFTINEPKLFGEPSIRIVKNRHGIDNNEVSLDNLTNYKYICKHG